MEKLLRRGHKLPLNPDLRITSLIRTVLHMNPFDPGSSDIVSRLMDGDLTAVHDLMSLCGPKIIVALCHKHHLADDEASLLLLDAAAKICGTIHSFDESKGGIDAYLLTVASNLAVDYLETCPRCITMSPQDAALRLATERAARQRCEEENELLRDCITRAKELIDKATLTPYCKQVLTRILSGESDERIAEELDSTRSSVRSAKSKAIRVLKEML